MLKAILEILQNNPLPPTLLLAELNSGKFKGEFKIKSLSGLRKDHLKYFTDKKALFSLQIKDSVEFGGEKVPAKEFFRALYGTWGKGGQKNYYHAYYFATPKTHFIKTKIFDDIIRMIFLQSDIKNYINKKDEIEKCLQEIERLLPLIEIFPNEKEGFKEYPTENISQWIINHICDGKNVHGAFYLIVDYLLSPKLVELESYLSLDNANDTYLNSYRILRKELYERNILALPNTYRKFKRDIREQYQLKITDENVDGLIMMKHLERITNKKEKLKLKKV